MSPPSITSLASSTVTPHSSIPSSIAQSSDDGPRSPGGPGCTTRQRYLLQTVAGMNVLSIGQTISSGRWRSAAASIGRARVDDVDGDVVPELGERDERALAEAVVGGDDEQDPRPPGPRAGDVQERRGRGRVWAMPQRRRTAAIHSASWSAFDAPAGRRACGAARARGRTLRAARGRAPPAAPRRARISAHGASATMRPPESSTARSHSWAANGRSWVTTSIVRSTRVEDLQQLAARPRVEVRGRLVEHQQPRAHREHGRDRDAPALAERELVRRAVDHVRHPHRRQRRARRGRAPRRARGRG